MQEYPDSMQADHDAEAYWEHTAPYLRYCQATSYYRQFIYNYRNLYSFDSFELSKEDFLIFSEQMDQNFKNYEAWLDHVCEKNNIDLMFADRLWQAFDADFDADHFRYVFRFDQLVLQIDEAAESGFVGNKQALDFLELDEFRINSLEDYLSYVDQILVKLVSKNLVALKMGLAYHRSIDVEQVAARKAQRIFQQSARNSTQKKQLQDYLIYHIAGRAAELNLPVQIHTGYLHGNGGLLDRGHPVKLIPLIRDNPNTKFVLFHGGYPWTGEFAAMGKHYPNVYLDLVWLPQISRHVAIRTLHEILDTVPYNKLFWGSDVGNIDDAAGSLELGREVVATVLAERMENEGMTIELAHDVARCIFRENAIEVFELEKIR